MYLYVRNRPPKNQTTLAHTHHTHSKRLMSHQHPHKKSTHHVVACANPNIPSKHITSHLSQILLLPPPPQQPMKPPNHELPTSERLLHLPQLPPTTNTLGSRPNTQNRDTMALSKFHIYYILLYVRTPHE